MEKQSTRVLVADDEPMTRAILAQAVHRAGFSPVLASDGEQALKLLEGPSAPRLALLDWVMPKLDGIEVCRRLRVQGRPHVYVLLVSASNRQENVLAGLDAGADGFIAKPFHPSEIIARLKAGERALGTEQNNVSDIRSVLSDALASLASGEIIIRSGEIIGKILLHQGQIVWVHVSSAAVGLNAALHAEARVSRDDLKLVFEECRQTGQNVLDVLLAWQLVDRALLREVVRRFFSQRLAELFSLPNASAFFVPNTRGFDGSISYLPEELLPTSEGAAQPPMESPQQSSSAFAVARRVFPEQLLEEAMTFDGAQSMAIFDRNTGQRLAAAGENVDLDVLIASARLCQLLPPADSLEDVLLTSSQHYQLFRAVPSSKDLLVYLRLNRASTSLAMARFHLTRLAEQIL